MPCSRGSAQHRDQTQVSCTAGGFFTNRATTEAPTNAGDTRDVVSIPGSGRSPGGGRGNPLSCLILHSISCLQIVKINACQLCKHFLPVRRLSFHFVDDVPHRANAF